MKGDRLGNKNTLIMRKGRKFGFKLIAVFYSFGEFMIPDSLGDKFRAVVG